MLTLIVLGASFVLLGRNHMLRERRETTENNVIELGRLATAYVRDGDFDSWDFRMTLSSIASSTGNHCFITDPHGEIIVCSDAALLCEHLGRSVPNRTMQQLIENRYYSEMTLLDGICTEASYVAALPIFAPDRSFCADGCARRSGSCATMRGSRQKVGTMSSRCCAS